MQHGADVLKLSLGDLPVCARPDRIEQDADSVAVIDQNGQSHRGQALIGADGVYDLVLCNPPYVNSSSMAALPDEYRHEPALALAGGEDGMDLVRRIVNDAVPKLTDIGVLVLEIGNERGHFEAAFRRLEVAWLETSAGDDAVLLVTREALLRWSKRSETWRA